MSREWGCTISGPSRVSSRNALASRLAPIEETIQGFHAECFGLETGLHWRDNQGFPRRMIWPRDWPPLKRQSRVSSQNDLASRLASIEETTQGFLAEWFGLETGLHWRDNPEFPRRMIWPRDWPPLKRQSRVSSQNDLASRLTFIEETIQGFHAEIPGLQKTAFLTTWQVSSQNAPEPRKIISLERFSRVYCENGLTNENRLGFPERASKWPPFLKPLKMAGLASKRPPLLEPLKKAGLASKRPPLLKPLKKAGFPVWKPEPRQPAVDEDWTLTGFPCEMFDPGWPPDSRETRFPGRILYLWRRLD